MNKGKKIKVLCVVGARPNFIKVAPLMEELKKYRQIKPILVHTGQHYDFEMSESFFKDLSIPKPNYNLEVGSGLHGAQTGKIIIEFEKVCLKEKPQLVIVVGDVNSTLAGALVAAKLHIPVAHIEAGLRSRDMTMPEEINRILTDHISDFLFVTEPAGVKNLLKENISKEKIYLVGDIMIDCLTNLKAKIQNSTILKKLKLKRKGYAVLTLHRPANVDDKKVFSKLISAFEEIQKKIKIVYPIHPRTKKQIEKFGFRWRFQRMKNFILIPPIGYIEMIKLVRESKFLMTDSGGLQEESTFLRVPCLTLRKNTERPITVEVGTNIVVGTNKNKILKEVNKILSGCGKRGKAPKYWDGKTAKRIVKILQPLFFSPK